MLEQHSQRIGRARKLFGMVFGADSCGSKEPCIRLGPDPHEKEHFWRDIGDKTGNKHFAKLLRILVSIIIVNSITTHTRMFALREDPSGFYVQYRNMSANLLLHPSSSTIG